MTMDHDNDRRQADIAVDQPFLRRLGKKYRPGMWIGSVRRAFGPIADLPGEEADAGVIETHPPHYLLALWRPLPPNEPFLPRWPAKVSLVAPDARAAVADMLREVPPHERLWLSERPIDWVLMADIVMLCEEGLVPYQFRGLREFVEMERQNTIASISVNYGGEDEMFEAFARTRPGEWA